LPGAPKTETAKSKSTQNSGRLSKRKHASHFDFLTNEEITAMEQATQSAYGDTAAYHT
jgi:hypothetical protein